MSRTLCMIAAAAAPIFAQPASAQLTEGCYVREYSDAHLASHPTQHIKTLKIIVQTEGAIDSDGEHVSVWALMANQGQAQRLGIGGQALHQSSFCGDYDGKLGCAVECDGGFLTIREASIDMLEFETSYFSLDRDGDCGQGLADLAETDAAPTTYKLDSRMMTECMGE